MNSDQSNSPQDEQPPEPNDADSSGAQSSESPTSESPTPESPTPDAGNDASVEGSPFKASPFQEGAAIKDTSAATFSMLHVVFWTMGVCVALSINNDVPVPENSAEFGKIMQMYNQAGRFAGGIFMGPMIGMLPFWFIYRRKGVSFPYHPGHWFLMHYGASFLVNVLGNWIIRSIGFTPVFGDGQFEAMAPIYVVAAFASIVGAIVAVIGYRSMPHERPIWRMVMGVMIIQGFLSGISSIAAISAMVISQWAMLMVMGTVGMVAGCMGMSFYVMTLVAIIMDIVEKNRRDWLHWMPFALAGGGMVVIAGVLIVGSIFLA